MQGRDGSLKSVALVMYHKMLCRLIKHSKNNVDRCFGLHSCWGTVSKANPKGFHLPEVLTENNRIWPPAPLKRLSSANLSRGIGRSRLCFSRRSRYVRVTIWLNLCAEFREQFNRLNIPCLDRMFIHTRIGTTRLQSYSVVSQYTHGFFPLSARKLCEDDVVNPSVCDAAPWTIALCSLSVTAGPRSSSPPSVTFQFFLQIQK